MTQKIDDETVANVGRPNLDVATQPDLKYVQSFLAGVPKYPSW